MSHLPTPGMDAFGTIVERAVDENDTAFEEVAFVTNYGGPSAARETYDVTHHRSPRRRREFIGGLVDEGELTLDVNYVPERHDFLVLDFDLRNARHYRMLLPDDEETIFTFAAILTGVDRAFPVDDKATSPLTFKLTGFMELSSLES